MLRPSALKGHILLSVNSLILPLNHIKVVQKLDGVLCGLAPPVE